MVTSSEPGSFSSRFLHQVLQLGLVRSLVGAAPAAGVVWG